MFALTASVTKQTKTFLKLQPRNFCCSFLNKWRFIKILTVVTVVCSNKSVQHLSFIFCCTKMTCCQFKNSKLDLWCKKKINYHKTGHIYTSMTSTLCSESWLVQWQSGNKEETELILLIITPPTLMIRIKYGEIYFLDIWPCVALAVLKTFLN